MPPPSCNVTIVASGGLRVSGGAMGRQNSDPLMLGLDLGTTGAKAGVVTCAGEVLATSTAEYETMTPQPGWAEQRPADWWEASVAAIREAVGVSGAAASDIRGMGVSGQMHGSVFLDAARSVVRPCILWCDQRAAAQCATITDLVGEEGLAAMAGNPALAGFTAPKILWLRECEPESYSRVRQVILPKDFINMKLTGELATDASDASGTLLFDIRERSWSVGMLERLGIRRDWLPDVHESCDEIGTVTPEAAEATGLAAGMVVAAGGADNACGALGMGVTREGQVAVSIGSSGTVLAPTERPEVDPEMRLHSFCHAVPETWYLMGVVLSAGLSLKWFRDELGEPEVSAALRLGKDPYELLDVLAGQAPAGCEGLVFLPYLSGERTPHADPDARGVLFGIDLTKKRRHVVRSVMEGVTYGLNDSVSIMRDMGVPLDEAVAGGGGSRSRLWRTMLADIFEMPIRKASEPDSAMLGAALLGGVAAGLFPTVRDACAAATRSGEPVEPDPATRDAYRAACAKYRALYPALEPLFP
jgi:xylulokinase